MDQIELAVRPFHRTHRAFRSLLPGRVQLAVLLTRIGQRGIRHLTDTIRLLFGDQVGLPCLRLSSRGLRNLTSRRRHGFPRRR